MMTIDAARTAFAEGTLRLATESGFPVLSPSGRFVHDARCAWLIEGVETWHEHLRERRYDRGWFHASSFGKTDAELIAAYRGEEPEDAAHDARQLRVFDLGHARDANWKGYLQASGLSVVGDPNDRRIRIPYLRLVGECDDIVRGPEGFWVFELKTINPYAFGQLNAPREEHVAQVHCYMAGLALRDALVLYEHKGDQSLRAFAVPWDQSVWDGIVGRLLRLRREADAE